MQIKFKTLFYDPICPEPIEVEYVAHDTIVDHFEKIDWNGCLQKSKNAKLDDIYYHPTFEIEREKTKQKLGISAIGNSIEFEFNITYTRPKKEMVKSFFILKEKITENYLTMIQGQTKNDALDCLKAFIRNDVKYLSNKIGL